MYQVKVSPTRITNLTEAVLDQVKAWHSRPLDAVCPIVYLDALAVKMRTDGHRALHAVVGIGMEGNNEVLGLWTMVNEGGKFWLQVLTEPKNCGLKGIFIACVDGLKGFSQAIEMVYPRTTVQLRIVPMTRDSLNYVSWNDCKQVAMDLKAIYRAATADYAERHPADFVAKWSRKYPTIGAFWRRKWQVIAPSF
jgi:putative transposase